MLTMPAGDTVTLSPGGSLSSWPSMTASWGPDSGGTRGVSRLVTMVEGGSRGEAGVPGLSSGGGRNLGEGAMVT